MSTHKSSPKKDKVLNLIILVLVIVAIYLGYSVYRKSQNKGLENKNISVNNSSPSGSIVATSSSNTSLPRKLPSNLSEEEKKVLDFESVKSDEEKRAQMALAQKLAKQEDNLEISGCSGNPVVIKVKLGQNLTLKNNDKVKHNFIVNNNHQYEVAAESVKSIIADFQKGPGLYGYRCDSFGTSGVILVIE